jgi:hypothetical protein
MSFSLNELFSSGVGKITNKTRLARINNPEISAAKPESRYRLALFLKISSGILDLIKSEYWINVYDNLNPA